MFSCEFCEIFTNTFSTEQLRMTASDKSIFGPNSKVQITNLTHHICSSNKCNKDQQTVERKKHVKSTVQIYDKFVMQRGLQLLQWGQQGFKNCVSNIMGCLLELWILQYRNIYTYIYINVNKFTLSWRRLLSYRNQSIDLLCKSMDWFLFDKDLRHERDKLMQNTQQNSKSFLLYIHEKIYANLLQIKINTTKFLVSINKIKIQLQMLH